MVRHEAVGGVEGAAALGAHEGTQPRVVLLMAVHPPLTVGERNVNVLESELRGHRKS